MPDPVPPRGPGGQFVRPLPDDPGLPRADPGSGGTAGAKVTVACKLPWGLILRVGDMHDEIEPVMGGGVREVKVWRARPGSVVVKGNVAPYGVVPDWPIVAGFGLTHDVDKEFWDKWAADNARHPLVTRGLIHAYEQPAAAADAAREKAALKSGLEPLDPQHLPPGFGAIQTAQRAGGA